MTGELIGAVVDRRFGSQAPRITTNSWDDVVAIIDYWSEWSRFRFCQERGDNDCVAPHTLSALCALSSDPSKEQRAHAFRAMPGDDERHRAASGATRMSVPSCTTDTLVSMRPGCPP